MGLHEIFLKIRSVHVCMTNLICILVLYTLGNAVTFLISWIKILTYAYVMSDDYLAKKAMMVS